MRKSRRNMTEDAPELVLDMDPESACTDTPKAKLQEASSIMKGTHFKQKLLAIDKSFNKSRRLFIVILYAWLFMNIDPAYSQKTLGAMVASKLLQGSILTMAGKEKSAGPTNGMSTVEAIALIQAMNGNRGSPYMNDLKQTEPSSISRASERDSTPRHSISRHLNRREPTALRQNPLVRQILDEMVDRQAPTDEIQSRQSPAAPAAAVVLAALAAFLAAAAAGLTPLYAAAAAYAAAALIALAALKQTGNQQALIKKLIIKKTVLPFVIPIPYKHKEKEVVYKYIPKPYEGHKEQHHHHYHKGEKHKKMDEPREEIPDSYAEASSLNKIEKLIVEQDNLQELINEATGKKAASSR